MTAATPVTEGASPSKSSRSSTPRRAPDELLLGFADEAHVRSGSAARSEPDWLLADRLAALARYAELPVEANRLYTTYVDFRAVALDGVELRQAPVVLAAAATLPDGLDGFIEIDEDGGVSVALSADATRAGVVLETLSSTLHRDPALLRQHVEGGASLPADDKLAALTRAFWSQGVLLRVPDGVRLERPVLVRWVTGTPGGALLTRTIVSVGEDAGVSIVEEQVSSASTAAVGAATGAAQALFAGTTEVSVGRASSLAVAGLQDFGPNVIAFLHRTATAGEGASVRWALAQLGTRLVRSRVDNLLEGNHSSVEQAEIVFGGGEQLFDLTSYTRHVGRDTTGNLLSKGILQDAARSYMKGLITIEKTAVGTDSFLGEFGMNLTRATRSVAIPSLEIDQPDCRRVAHSSSVGPIDETQLFYLESRGIPPDEARKFIVLGFLEPVVARVPLATAQDRLRELLEEKWAAGRRSAVA